MKIIAPAFLLLLAACGQDAVERPTDAENDRLNEMDAMLDELGEGGDAVGEALVNEAD
ncbi:hypothetical protein [Sphingomicrobium flavum]|uniref:hypothetical protein n=1 Tax=Sphingomicrobium flavum TaxID=1229164 RepID=UPI0021ADAF32|nr:hypothetical protein [Sphingomicrobium flavum]